ncbi:putative transmembrane protein [Rhodovulum sp. P5]|nr:putative transmembrane protein [Rhodovulum sp. P5]
MFVTTHVIGSNNNLEARDIKAVEEFFARNAADIDWLKESFAAAGDAEALVLAIHADMFEFDFALPWDSEGYLRHSGFKAFAETLMAEANAFGKPVLLMFGDSHKFRMFRPFPSKSPHVMAIETFGSADMHAVEVMVDTDASYPFGARPLINAVQPIEWKE